MKKTSIEQNKLNLNLSERGSRSGEKGKITVNNFSYTNRSILEITELKIKTHSFISGDENYDGLF